MFTYSTEYVNIVNTNGTAATAITMTALAGGINMTVNDASTLKLGNEGADTYIQVAPHGTAATELIKILNTAGTAVAEDGAAIQLSSIAGGISIQSDGDLDDAITIRADGGTTAEMTIHNDQGTSESSIDIISDAGGIDITCATAKNMDLTGGQIALLSNEDAASAISLTTNTGTTETIVITNTLGDTTAAINIDATAGGIDIDSAKDVAIDLSAATANFDVDSALGSVYLDGGEAAVDAIKLAATNAAGGIDIDYGTGAMTVTGTGAAANFTLDADLLSIDGTGTSNVTVTANVAAEDFTIAQAGVLDASLILSSTGTAADALQLTAATGTGGITLNAGTGLINFSDDALANIGDIAVDEIKDEATPAISYAVKTRTVTIGHVGDATADYQWTTAADHVAQNLDLGAIVPAFARVIDVAVICTETMVGQTNMLLVVGNASAGNQFIASTDCDTINNSIAGAAAGAPFAAISNSASNVWVQGDPDDNTWAAMSAGIWSVMVTYIDNNNAKDNSD